MSGKKYIVLIELKDVRAEKLFAFDKSNFGNMDN
jgi:hypothetical protein